MPKPKSSLTECWVGFVLNSFAEDRNGTKVKWINNVLLFPSSFRNWRIASKNGKLSMSPTVPPISQITKSSLFKSF